jgi:ATP-dependent exoDNAse (exonuclease V) beta subunit
VPLLENSLAAGGSLFAVGDPKQSIYSFRGADWTIMTREMRGGSFPSAPAEVRPLAESRRSKEVLVRFVAEVFERVVPGTAYADALPLSGLDSVRQTVLPDAENAGYVRVELFEQGDAGDDPARDKVVETVKECLVRGHRPSDIAILAPGNDAVVRASGWLNREGIPVLSHSNLDIRKRKAAGEILALLKFLDAPIDDLAFATVLTGTLFARRIAGTEHAGVDVAGFLLGATEEPGAALSTRFRHQFPRLWEELFEGLVKVVGTMPLYDMVNRALHAFDVFSTMPGEEAMLAQFLQAVLRCEAQGEGGIKDLLRAADEDEEGWDIDAPKRAQAVRVMTIHKAKGLGFPVVIVLLEDRKPRTSSMLVGRTGSGVQLLYAKKDLQDRVPEVREVREAQIRRDRADELNRLYVALTRAEDEMVIFGTYKGTPGVPTMFLPSAPVERGARRVPHPEPAGGETPAPIVHIAQEVQPPASPPREAGYAEMLRGDFLHGVLAGASGPGDPRLPALAAETAAALGVGVPPEGALERVESFLTLPAVTELFAAREGRKMLVEQELVDREGRLHRADRIVVDPGLVTVVDFKTGGDEFEQDYRRQVRTYMRLASDLFPGRTVEGLIAYVDRRSVVSVE